MIAMNSHKLIPYLIIVCALGIMGCSKDNHKNIITECVGTVVEGINMNPLPNVTVSVTNGSRVLVSTVTDDHGTFSLFVDFEKVTVEDSLLLDGRPSFPYLKKEALKGMGREQYDYKTLVLYEEEAELSMFRYSGVTYFVHPDVGRMTWENAMNFCANLHYMGYSDWYLPNRLELHAMYVYCNSIGGFVTSPPYSEECYYWSSERRDDDYQQAWYQDFASGMETHGFLTESHRVRPIRKSNGKNASR